MKVVNVKIKFFEPILGTSPNNPEIAREFIASKAPDAKMTEEEIEALGVDAVVEKGMTVFPRNENGKPFYYDYQVKGYFKDVCGMLSRIAGTKSKGTKAYKKIIDGLIFPEPRRIDIDFDGEMGNCQRPLRAMTMQGERVSLANSEQIPVGAEINFRVKLFADEFVDLLTEWFDYGKYRGFGQWRNSGMGRFNYTMTDENGKVISSNM